MSPCGICDRVPRSSDRPWSGRCGSLCAKDSCSLRREALRHGSRALRRGGFYPATAKDDRRHESLRRVKLAVRAAGHRADSGQRPHPSEQQDVEPTAGLSGGVFRVGSGGAAGHSLHLRSAGRGGGVSDRGARGSASPTRQHGGDCRVALMA